MSRRNGARVLPVAEVANMAKQAAAISAQGILGGGTAQVPPSTDRIWPVTHFA
jgi:hypothetical protein